MFARAIFLVRYVDNSVYTVNYMCTYVYNAHWYNIRTYMSMYLTYLCVFAYQSLSLEAQNKSQIPSKSAICL